MTTTVPLAFPCQRSVTGGDHQRNAARNGNQGSHQNGPQAQKGDRRRDFHQAFVALHFQIGKFHDQDGILAAHPASIPRPICAQGAISRLNLEMVSGVNSGTGNRHKVEMRTTRTAIGGISVARRFYRKMYTRSTTRTTTIMHMRLVLCPAGATSRHSMKEHEVRDYGKRPMP